MWSAILQKTRTGKIHPTNIQYNSKVTNLSRGFKKFLKKFFLNQVY